MEFSRKFLEIFGEIMRKKSERKIKNISRKVKMTTRKTQFVPTRARATAGSSWAMNQNLTPFVAAQKLGPVANFVIVALLVVLMGLLYLSQLTKTGSFSYEINKINEQKTELAAEQDNLKVENARLRSINRIQSSEVAAAMTTPREVASAQ